MQTIMLKQVNKELTTREVEEVNLELLQECVGGYIEEAYDISGVKMLVNEESIFLGGSLNFYAYDHPIYDDVVFVGVDDDDYIGLTEAQQDIVIEFMKRYTR